MKNVLILISWVFLLPLISHSQESEVTRVDITIDEELVYLESLAAEIDSAENDLNHSWRRELMNLKGASRSQIRDARIGFLRNHFTNLLDLEVRRMEFDEASKLVDEAILLEIETQPSVAEYRNILRQALASAASIEERRGIISQIKISEQLLLIETTPED